MYPIYGGKQRHEDMLGKAFHAASSPGGRSSRRHFTSFRVNLSYHNIYQEPTEKALQAPQSGTWGHCAWMAPWGPAGRGAPEPGQCSLASWPAVLPGLQLPISATWSSAWGAAHVLTAWNSRPKRALLLTISKFLEKPPSTSQSPGRVELFTSSEDVEANAQNL